LEKPFGYLEFVGLLVNAGFVITDSGGVQEETAWLDIPCITLRNSTERPVTISRGTNRLVGDDPNCLLKAVRELRDYGMSRGQRRPIPLWDGDAGNRIADHIARILK